MKQLLKKIIPQPIINYCHKLKAVGASVIFKNSRQVKIIGVTGTDGKTTTTFLIEAILKQAGYKVALFNGLVFRVGDNEIPNKTDNSTPSGWVLHKLIKQAKKEKCDYIIIEVTSWGLSQYRTWGIPFYGAIFTNISYEHQDLHKTMDSYKKAKARLFKSLRKKDSLSILNKDDDSFEYYSKLKSSRTLSYSINKKADVRAADISEQPETSNFVIEYEQNKQPIELAIPGSFNVYNALAAICLGLAENIKIDIIRQALKDFNGVKGRFEYVHQGQPFKVIVDFAHTPQAFEQLFKSISKIYKGSKIIGVYGATGGRDETRRQIQGKIAGKYLNYSVLTEEDPREEDPEIIAQEIIKGLQKQGKKHEKDYIFIKNRKDAIKYAFTVAQENDVVLLLSMGHYEVMYVGKGKVKWNDKKAAIKCLKELGYK